MKKLLHIPTATYWAGLLDCDVGDIYLRAKRNGYGFIFINKYTEEFYFIANEAYIPISDDFHEFEVIDD